MVLGHQSSSWTTMACHGTAHSVDAPPTTETSLGAGGHAEGLHNLRGARKTNRWKI